MLYCVEYNAELGFYIWYLMLCYPFKNIRSWCCSEAVHFNKCWLWLPPPPDPLVTMHRQTRWTVTACSTAWLLRLDMHRLSTAWSGEREGLIRLAVSPSPTCCLFLLWSSSWEGNDPVFRAYDRVRRAQLCVFFAQGSDRGLGCAPRPGNPVQLPGGPQVWTLGPAPVFTH